MQVQLITELALLSNSSPSLFQSKSNGQGVDFVFPLSQQQQEEEEEEEEERPHQNLAQGSILQS